MIDVEVLRLPSSIPCEARGRSSENQWGIVVFILFVGMSRCDFFSDVR